ncbi:UNVERIFIED_CONTAM: hypothetical protein GTU68_051088 [Idotea baltica]|nr:hypothetical protein [Idotea baltica]
MKVLVIGSGGREHTLCWKLKQSEKVDKIYCAPGNPGISEIAENIPYKVDDIENLVNFAIENKIDLTIVGPEDPLSKGISDEFIKNNLKVFGPQQKPAQIESSKKFAKEIMIAAGVPTAFYESFDNLEDLENYINEKGAPIVLKADGLAAGKGVFVCLTKEEAIDGARILFNEFSSEKVLAEQYLEGKEASVFIASDGKKIVPLGSAHDYKRIFDNDEGANTGGMGTVSPTPNITKEQEEWIIENVSKPVIEELNKQGMPFCGFLYAGLMISPEGKIDVIEFNCRFGDPEAQSVLRRLDTDLFDILYSLSGGDLNLPEIKWKDDSCVCLVLASKGYPQTSSKDDLITGLDHTNNEEVVVFHAGTKENNGKIFTNGGRVLNITAMASNQKEAREKAYKALESIDFDGKQYRTDIAL